MRAFVVKNFENKAGSTQRVWEGYAERHAIAQASHPDSTKRYGKEKALKSKAGSTQRVWEDYAELIAVALVNATITTDATATKNLSRPLKSGVKGLFYYNWITV